MAKIHKQNLHFTRETWQSTLLRELSMGICVLISVIFIIMDATNSKALDNGKMALQRSFSPIFSATTKFANIVDDFFLNFNTVSELNKKNESLLKENADMQAWRNRALRYEAENKSLKDLLKFSEDFDYEFQSARIAIDNSGGYNKRVVVNAKGLEIDQSVMSAWGIVGRILNVSEDYASVLLITDVNSKIPVVLERTRAKALAIGKNHKDLDLEYLPEDSEVTLGDRVITSGDGGVFLPGLFVGTVSYIEGNNVEVKPATNFDILEFVSVLRKEKDK